MRISEKLSGVDPSSDTHKVSSPASINEVLISFLRSVPLVINSAFMPIDLILEIIGMIRGCERGSPNPPKNTFSDSSGKDDRPAIMESNTSSVIIPGFSSQTCLIHVRQLRLHIFVTSIYNFANRIGSLRVNEFPFFK